MMTVGADDGWSLGNLVDAVGVLFAAHGVRTPREDARVLVSGLLGLDLTALVLQVDRPINRPDLDRVQPAAGRRCAGEPVHRILGSREFYGLDLRVSSATLEPRPDTEVLVDTVLAIGRDIVARTGACRILDLGTGTGAICLALLAYIAEASAGATDISCEALAVARTNAERLGLAGRFDFRQSNWFEFVDGSFDLIVSNPPYIRSAEIAGLDHEVRAFDPILALDGGADGLNAYRAIARDAARHLRAGGRIAVEIGYDQRQAVASLFDERGFACLSEVKDLGGCDRVLVFAIEDTQRHFEGTGRETATDAALVDFSAVPI